MTTGRAPLPRPDRSRSRRDEHLFVIFTAELPHYFVARFILIKIYEHNEWRMHGLCLAER